MKRYTGKQLFRWLRERERKREIGTACIQLTSTLSGSLKGLSTALSASLLGSDWLLLRRLPPGLRWIFFRWGEAGVTANQSSQDFSATFFIVIYFLQKLNKAKAFHEGLSIFHLPVRWPLHRMRHELTHTVRYLHLIKDSHAPIVYYTKSTPWP